MSNILLVVLGHLWASPGVPEHPWVCQGCQVDICLLIETSTWFVRLSVQCDRREENCER